MTIGIATEAEMGLASHEGAVIRATGVSNSGILTLLFGMTFRLPPESMKSWILMNSQSLRVG